MTTKKALHDAKAVLEKMDGPLTFASMMRALREAEEWSQADMAKVLGVTKSHIAHMESGKAVAPKSASRYAKILGYSEASFVRLVLQDELRAGGIELVVALTPKKKRAA